MSLPKPEVGLVLSYAYLWCHENDRGQREGRKARPCVIVLAVEERQGGQRVTVVPVTHQAPDNLKTAIEMPAKVKRHLGLDDERSWIILSEVNQFDWPGFDLRPIPGVKGRFDYGFIPPKLFEKIKAGLLGLFLERRLKTTRRD